MPFNLKAMRKGVTPQQVASEETKLLKVEESVRIFVRVADPKFRQVVPMRFFNLTLTPAEADAYCADYLEEKSLRAGVAWGPALPRAGDLYGHAVNLASRVTGIARPFSVLCTKEIRDAAGDDFDFSYAGRHRLKGIGSSVPLYRARPLPG